MKLARPLLVALLALSPGCATILRDSMERVEVVTSPPGALISVNGSVQGYSPITLEFYRDAKQPIVGAWIEGFRPEYVKLERIIDGDGVNYLLLDLLVVPFLASPAGMWIALAADLGGENLYAFRDKTCMIVIDRPSQHRPPRWALAKLGGPEAGWDEDPTEEPGSSPPEPAGR